MQLLHWVCFALCSEEEKLLNTRYLLLVLLLNNGELDFVTLVLRLDIVDIILASWKSAVNNLRKKYSQKYSRPIIFLSHSL